MKDERGRPTVMTEEVIRKLEDGFLKGMTDREACLYADISSSTFYKFCQENPDFSERKEELRDNVKMRARINVAEAIVGGDKPLSQWYLERKAKDEFSGRTETTGKDGEPLNPTPQELDVEKLAQEMAKELKKKKV